MKYASFINQITCLLALTLSLSLTTGCGKDSSNGTSSTSQGSSGGSKQPGGKNSPIGPLALPSGPAYFQYTAGGFDPKSVPTTVSKKKGKTKENAGVLVYTTLGTGASSRIYALLGHEKQHGLWSHMKGSVEIGDSYIKTAAKELHEETAGIYHVSESHLLKSSYDVVVKSNYGCTFFVGFPHFPEAKILAAANAHPNADFQEMKDYAWVALDDLLTALRAPVNRAFAVKTADGNSKTILLDGYSFQILSQADANGILTNLK